ncbi:hypothetical protein EKN06_00625 [Croceicoccus ponticola]|uniref:Uncharacterized protein n=1 Tax=Croceicoccus ponticola TaxID=2217664 RepID=A0A437GZK8_9SPHN|nr:hypothetical protein [Croceicoccus ponticola]RVQ68773.1 hypothetical protein EKN06_00625 [Croceicoccus ponticola]
MHNLDAMGLRAVILEMESCLTKVDALGLTRAGAILDTALVELRSIQRSIDVIDEAGRSGGG